MKYTVTIKIGRRLITKQEEMDLEKTLEMVKTWSKDDGYIPKEQLKHLKIITTITI